MTVSTAPSMSGHLSRNSSCRIKAATSPLERVAVDDIMFKLPPLASAALGCQGPYAPCVSRARHERRVAERAARKKKGRRRGLPERMIDADTTGDIARGTMTSVLLVLAGAVAATVR